MKTLLFAMVLGFGVAGLQAGDALAELGAKQAAERDARLAQPAPDNTQAQILAEMKKQTKLLEAQQPTVLYDPNVKVVPVTVVPVR